MKGKCDFCPEVCNSYLYEITTILDEKKWMCHECLAVYCKIKVTISGLEKYGISKTENA